MKSSFFKSRLITLLFVPFMLLLFGTHVTIAQEIPSPEDYFGFQMGTDRKLARWDKMVEYYHLIGEKSPRVHVLDMGPSTLGNPFLVLFISIFLV